MEIPANWMIKGLEILSEVNFIVKLIRRASDKMKVMEQKSKGTTLENDVIEMRVNVDEIMDRSRKLVDMLPIGLKKNC